MYKIRIYDDTTLDGLLESFKNLEKCGIEGYVEIDGKTVYGKDPILKEKLRDIFQSREKIPKTKKIRKIITENNNTYRSFRDAWSLSDLSHNVVFKYYLGVSLQYIKEEYREDLKKYYISVYCNDKHEELRDIHLLANILTILEYDDMTIIHEKLNLLFLNITKEDRKKLLTLMIRIKKFAIKGFLVEKCFYENILDEDIKKMQKNKLGK